jgi:hypothetical protein
MHDSAMAIYSHTANAHGISGRLSRIKSGNGGYVFIFGTLKVAQKSSQLECFRQNIHHIPIVNDDHNEGGDEQRECAINAGNQGFDERRF